MNALDDEAALRSADPSGLIDAYLGLDRQLGTAFADASAASAASAKSRLPPRDDLHSVVFSGMGGSSAAADVTMAAYADRFPLPCSVVRGYRLPAHAGPGTLVVCVSYSGNTEETLAIFEEAARRRCGVVAVSSGGELAARAHAQGAPHILLPGNLPQPRAALGSLTGAVLGVLSACGLIDAAGDVTAATGELPRIAADLAREVPAPRNEAKDVAAFVGDRYPVVWGSEGVTEAAAWRWRCAFNENAKLPAFSSALPELDHHEVVGWADGRGDGFGLLILRAEGEHETVGPRLEATLEEIGGSGLEHREIWARGSSPLVRTLALMLTGDAASAYHALARGVDPGPIDAIARLKARLA